MAAAFMFSLLSMARPLPAEIYDHDQVKAVFLFNLTHFIQWPAGKTPADDRPFTIAVFGRDRLQPYLDSVVRGESFNGRKVIVQRSRTLAQLDAHPCDLLFVGKDHMGLWPQIRAISHRHGILTVGDVEGFAHRGGMVNLLTLGRKIRIEINVNETRRNNFNISAKLLKLARIVNSAKDDR